MRFSLPLSGIIPTGGTPHEGGQVAGDRGYQPYAKREASRSGRRATRMRFWVSATS
jgi:hypothetical protein